MYGKVFIDLKIGHFFCPFFKSGDILWQKNNFSLQKLFLACGYQKNNYNFVTIKFIYLFIFRFRNIIL
jgi:hypothetical protein